MFWSIVDIVILSRPRSYDVMVRLSWLLMFAVFALGQLLYGGFASGMSSVHWNVIMVVASVLFFGVRSSLLFLILFFVSLVVVVLLEPFSSANGPLITMEARQVINFISLGSMAFVIFLGVLFLVSQLEIYRRCSNDLLLNILPRPIARRLNDNPQTIADGLGEVSVLFADIVDFTTMSSGENPVDIANLLTV